MERVRRILEATFGDKVSEAPAERAFFVPVGRTGVRVQVHEGDAVECYAWIARGATVTPELGLALARRNAGLRFGSLCVDGEDAIVLQHSLFPESVDEVLLPRVVMYIAAMADSIEDDLTAA